jgi:hypothetical protein
MPQYATLSLTSSRPHVLCCCKQAIHEEQQKVLTGWVSYLGERRLLRKSGRLA